MSEYYFFEKMQKWNAPEKEIAYIRRLQDKLLRDVLPKDEIKRLQEVE